MRSTSTSSGSTHGHSTTTLSWVPNLAGAVPSNRPLSAHSRNSEASSLSKMTGNLSQQQIVKHQQLSLEQESNDDYYLEPISKKGQISTVSLNPVALPSPPSVPQPKIPEEK
jgi:hypothetical protein